MAPEVSETSVVLGLSHALEILTHGGIDLVGDDLAPGAVLRVLLSVEEPLGDVVVSGTSDDVVDLLDLLLNELTSSLVDVDAGNAHGEERESAADTLDLAEAERSLLLTSQVGVLHTQDMLEIVHVLKYQGSHFLCLCMFSFL